MKKILTGIILLLFSFSAQVEIYRAKDLEEIRSMAEDILSRRNPRKTFFIFPLEGFILNPAFAAFHKQDASYEPLVKKAFEKAKESRLNYINELILMDYPQEVIDKTVIDLINYLQENKAGVIITTPNITGGINKIDFFDVWTVNYLKTQNIDLTKGIFADKKFVFSGQMKKANGSYPGFYQGLLSYNSQGAGRDNSVMQALSVLFTLKLKEMPEIIVAVSADKNYLEVLEKQLKILKEDNEFYGILYDPPPSPTGKISPDEYLKFWQDFVKKLNQITVKEVDLKSGNNPYDE